MSDRAWRQVFAASVALALAAVAFAAYGLVVGDRQQRAREAAERVCVADRNVWLSDQQTCVVPVPQAAP